jgi:hypothetical protein
MLFILNSCTENPFFKDDKISTKKVTGFVRLNDYGLPANIFVWFETLNLGTRTDNNGYFEIGFPSPSKQPGGGLNGFYKLYFYMANYKIEALEIFLRQGVPEYSKGALNDEGGLIQKVSLRKIVEVTGEIQTEISTPDTIIFQFTLKAVEDTVMASGLFSKAAFRGDPTFTAGFIKKVGADISSAQLLYNVKKNYATTDFPIPQFDLNLVPMVIYPKQANLTPGDYEIIPFLLLKQPDLPAGLWDALGGDVKTYSTDHLNMPMFISGNRITIK